MTKNTLYEIFSGTLVDNQNEVDEVQQFVENTQNETAVEEKLKTEQILQNDAEEVENKRRRQSIANMILELPSGSSEENRLKLFDLYSVCN